LSATKGSFAGTQCRLRSVRGKKEESAKTKLVSKFANDDDVITIGQNRLDFVDVAQKPKRLNTRVENRK